MNTPAHTHDCEHCLFVGADVPAKGEPACNQVDMYVHLNPSRFITVLRRFSSIPHDYCSMDSTAPIPKYQRVVKAWQAKNENKIL